MANEYYVTAATPPNDTDEANTANAYYISAGIIPTDILAGVTVDMWHPEIERPYIETPEIVAY